MPTPTEVMQRWLVQMDQERKDRDTLGMPICHDLWDAGGFLSYCLEGVNSK